MCRYKYIISLCENDFNDYLRKKKSFLIQLLSSLFSEENNNSKNSNSSSLMPWEKELVDKNVYEPYHFEEEDLEDDDYYSEDD